MTVISGVLKGPMGDARVGVVIELRAVKTSATVVNQARSQSVTNATGHYSLNVEPGAYDVMITASGRQPERVGGITVALNSQAGTLNDFLNTPGETDLNPEIVATVDRMRADAAKSAAAAKTSENNAAAAMTNALSKVTTTDQSVAGAVLFSKHVRLASATSQLFEPTTQGAWVVWNRATATTGGYNGATDFINHKGTGSVSGGFNFWNYDGTSMNLCAGLSATGSLSLKGTLSSIGDQYIQAKSDNSNLLVRFKDKDGVEKGAIYAQTDTGAMNIRWNGSSNTASFRPDGFVGLSNGLILGNAFSTAASIPDTAGLPIIFRGASTAGLSATPNSINVGTNHGFAVVPLSDTGLAEGVTRGVPVFSVSAVSGITYVAKDLKIGPTSVLKVGDYGLGAGAASFTGNLDDNTVASGIYYVQSGATGTKPQGVYGHLVVSREGTGGSARQMWTANNGSTLWVRHYINSTWSPWVMSYNTGNTTVDANGFIKKASPIVKLFGDGNCELNDQSQGVTTERISEGVYRISGTLGFNADAEWGGVDGGIEIPTDRNKLPLVWVDYEVDETGDLLIKTFHRINSTAPKFAQNVKAGYEEGQPIDIPVGRWIDLRVEMPGVEEPEFMPEPEPEVVPDSGEQSATE